MKKSFGILIEKKKAIGILIESVDSLGYYGYFNNVNSLNPITQCIFPLVLEFYGYRPFASVGRFVSRYITLIDVMLNGIVPWICLFDISLLVYRNARDFCLLILYPATFTRVHQWVYYFLVASLGFSMYSIMSRQTVTVLLLPFQFEFLLFIFSSLTAMARISRITLNKRGDSGHLCLFPILEEMLSAFHHWEWR